MSNLSEKRQEPAADKPGPRWLWLGLAAALVVAAWAGYYFYYRTPPSTLDGFAQCLKSKGAKMYGAWWCPHCQEQKDLFGFAFQYVNYTECSPEGEHTMNDTCKQAGIKSYPTWQYPDGSRTEGTQPLATLAQKTGCKLP